MIFKCYNLVLRSIRGVILHSIAIEPSFVAWREAKEPLKPPIGVRLTAEIYTSAQRGLIICSDVYYGCVLHTTRSHFWYNCSLNRTACKAVIKTFNGVTFKLFKRWLGNLVTSICNHFRNSIFFKYKLSFQWNRVLEHILGPNKSYVFKGFFFSILLFFSRTGPDEPKDR